MGGAEVFGLRRGELERSREWAPERIAVAGGDGTIGPVAELAGALGVPLAVIPAGTANDFARANGLPLDPIEAAPAGGDAARRCAPLELGRLADGRPFVNVASAGLASRGRAPRAAAEVALRAAGLRDRAPPARRRPAGRCTCACASTARRSSTAARGR